MRRTVGNFILLLTASAFLQPAFSQTVDLSQVKKAVAYLITDVERLKAENKKLKKELEELKKENDSLKKEISLLRNRTPELPKIFSETKLKPYLLYVGAYKSFKGAVLKASQLLNERENPLVISLKDKDFFAVALECSSLKECKEKEKKFHGFISYQKERGRSVVFNLRETFNRAKEKLKGEKTFAVVDGFPFYRIKTDSRMVRPYPHIKDGDSFIILKLEGTL